jgi:hypothetical protein
MEIAPLTNPRKPAMVKQWIVAAVVVGLLLIPAPSFARAWRDQKGNVINADFVKVEGGMVYLKPENKYANATPFPFYDFSEADQDFVKGLLAKKGQLDRIPPPPPKQDRNGAPAANQGSNLPVRIAPNTAGGGSNVPKPADTIPDIPDPYAAKPAAIPIAVAPTVAPTFPTPANPAPVNPTPNVAPTPAPTLPASRVNPLAGNPSPFGQQFVEQKQCMSCRKEVPQTATAGQTCPHCGVR